jgi:hypothetical protein
METMREATQRARRPGGSPAALAVIPPVSVADFADPDWIAPFAREAEALGFESLILPSTSSWPSTTRAAIPIRKRDVSRCPTTV